ncbi:MAG: hypothetical protein AB7Q76_04180 [Gammaproteobacteria bacterium]
MGSKIPYLFYWESSEDAWVPASSAMEEAFLQVFPPIAEHEDKEELGLRFRVDYMTEEEFNALPEV